MRNLSDIDKDRIIEMAWEDRTPFEAIFFQFIKINQKLTLLHPFTGVFFIFLGG